jgi:hypothetical protein
MATTSISSVSGNENFTNVDDLPLEKALSLGNGLIQPKSKNNYLDFIVTNAMETSSTPGFVPPGVFKSKNMIIFQPTGAGVPNQTTFIQLGGSTTADSQLLSEVVRLQNILFDNNPKVGDQFTIKVLNNTDQNISFGTGANTTRIELSNTGVAILILTVSSIVPASESFDVSLSPSWGGLGSSRLISTFTLTMTPAPATTEPDSSANIIPASLLMAGMNSTTPLQVTFISDAAGSGNNTTGPGQPLPLISDLLAHISGLRQVTANGNAATNICNCRVVIPFVVHNTGGVFTWDTNTVTNPYTAIPATRQIAVDGGPGDLLTMAVDSSYLMQLIILQPPGATPVVDPVATLSMIPIHVN